MTLERSHTGVGGFPRGGWHCRWRGCCFRQSVETGWRDVFNYFIQLRTFLFLIKTRRTPICQTLSGSRDLVSRHLDLESYLAAKKARWGWTGLKDSPGLQTPAGHTHWAQSHYTLPEVPFTGMPWHCRGFQEIAELLSRGDIATSRKGHRFL